MEKTLKHIKVAFLLIALAIVGNGVFAGVAKAGGVVCENGGHTCHVILGDTVYHYEEVR